MQEWIKALIEEMKPMLDGNKHEGLPNGRNQVTPSKKKGGKSETTVDPKAFNEVSILFSSKDQSILCSSLTTTKEFIQQ